MESQIYFVEEREKSLTMSMAKLVEGTSGHIKVGPKTIAKLGKCILL